jgi:hypothetical protein
VSVTQQVAHERAVLAHLLGARAVAHARSLHDRGIGGLALRHQARHDVDERDEPVLVHGNLPARVTLHEVDHRAVGLHALDRPLVGVGRAHGTARKGRIGHPGIMAWATARRTPLRREPRRAGRG